MFDLNRRAIIQRIGHRFRSNMYIPVYHTNGQSIKNMIAVVVNCLVGMGLNALLQEVENTMVSSIRRECVSGLNVMLFHIGDNH